MARKDRNGDSWKLERLSFALGRRLQNELGIDAVVKFTDSVDFVSNDLELAAKFYLDAQLLDEVQVRYPDGWFEALKERFAPAWLKARLPVRYAIVKVTAAAFDSKVNMMLRHRGFKTRVIVSGTFEEEGEADGAD